MALSTAAALDLNCQLDNPAENAAANNFLLSPAATILPRTPPALSGSLPGRRSEFPSGGFVQHGGVPELGARFQPRASLACPKFDRQPISPSSSPAIKTPMKTAASPPIAKFSGGEDGRSGGFHGRSPVWVPLNCLLAALSSRPTSKMLAEDTPPLAVDISIWRSQRKATPLVEETQQIVVAAMEHAPLASRCP